MENLIQNGNFENLYNGTSWTALTAGLGGWQVGNGRLEVGAETVYRGGQGDRNNAIVELDYNGGVDNLFQNVQTEAGQTYTLNFDSALRAGTAAVTNTIEVYWNGARVASVDSASTNWQTNTFQVTGTGGADRLEFREPAGDSNGLGGLLDNVSLIQNDTTANLVQDGTFEAAYTGTGWTSSTTGFGSWQVASGRMEIGAETIYRGGQGDRNNAIIELDYGAGTQDAIFQTIQTQVGTVYDLSLDTAIRAGTAAGTNTVEVFWNGTQVGVVDPTSTNWATSTFQVTGTGGADRLEFREQAGDSDGLGGLINNVNLVASDTQAPVGNLIRNGDFEGLTTARWTTSETGFGAWQVGGNSGFLNNIPARGVTPTAMEIGQESAYLGTNNTTNYIAEISAARYSQDAIFQDVQTVAGQTYKLDFESARRPDSRSEETSQVDVLWNGEVIGQTNPSSGNFEDYTFHVVGTGGSDRLTFRETVGEQSSQTTGGILDNVSLVAVDGTTQIINGDAGTDFITGSDLGETINGGAGNDIINGGAGNDLIAGGTGRDYIDGGAGNDTVIIDGTRAS